MANKLNSMRVYALGLAHRAAADITRDSFRQLRNYVDLCAFLSHTDENKHFFELAQTALEKTDSLYYPLIQRALTSISTDTLCTAGVNLGVDALIYGAAELKRLAQETGRPYHWITFADAEDAEMAARISEGEAIGQYLWGFSVKGDASLDLVFTLAAAHPKSDFFVLLAPERMTPELAARLAGQDNLATILMMDAPEISEAMHNAVLLLKAQKALYALFARLDDSNIELALDSEWLSVLAEHSVVCFYSDKNVSPARADALMKEIYRMRTETGSPVLLLDWEKDSAGVGAAIAPNVGVEYRTQF